MPEETKPDPEISKAVDEVYRNSSNFSKEDRQQVATLMTSSITGGRVRKTLEGLQAAARDWKKLKEKREQDGWEVGYRTKGGDRGQLTKVVLEKKDKKVELSGDDAEFRAFKAAFDSRAALSRDLDSWVLRAAEDDTPKKIVSAASNLLYGAATDTEDDPVWKTVMKKVQEAGKRTDANQHHQGALPPKPAAEPVDERLAAMLRNSMTDVESVSGNPFPGKAGERFL
jgi:hypothetical protein